MTTENRPSRRVVWAAIGVLFIAALGAFFFYINSVPPGVTPQNGVTPESEEQVANRELSEFEARIEMATVRGRVIMKSAPPVGTREWYEWHGKLSDEDVEAYALAMDEAATPPPTTAQSGNVNVKDYLSPQQSLFPAKIATNYKPLLRIPDGIGIRPLQVDTVRGPNGFVTTMWARRAKGSLVIDWGNATLKPVSVDNIKEAGGPSPQYVPIAMFFDTGAPGRGIAFRNGNTSFLLPWTRQSKVRSFALDKEYRYAFGVEYGTASNTLESIVVLDTQKKRIAGIIPVPTAKSGAHCIFDTKENYLMVFDYDWQWIILFDLSQPNPAAPVPDAPRIEAKVPPPKPVPPGRDALVDRAGLAVPDPEIMKRQEKLMQRGLELLNSAPPLGSKEWRAWYRALEGQDQQAYTLALDHGPKPAAPAAPGPKPLAPEPVPEAPRIEKK